jgi:hypothetical protein
MPLYELSRRVSISIGGLLLVLFARTAVAGEASVASEGPKWEPTYYSTTVLAPKDGAAKFVSLQRGGVQTVYTSEVVGHSPLTPERAKHTPYFDQGIMVGFATGEKFDYRGGAVVNKQHLLDGHLPIVVTEWEDKDTPAPLHYEETSFARRMGDPVAIERGDENAAAMLALKITNPGPKDRVATVRLVVNASGNSQSRGYPALLYRAALKVDGNRALNAKGETRLTWSAPQGATVEPSLQAEPPKILEFGPATPNGAVRPGAANEPAFTRYTPAGRARENHQAHKAFDNFFPSYWTPETTIKQGPVGLGVEFPEKRRLRSVIVRWDAPTSMPPANGYRLEGFDGTKWFPIPCDINGKPADVLKNHPEVVTEIGQNWLLIFAPVEVKGFRVMVDKLMQGAERPSISGIDYSSTYGADAKSGEPIWSSTESDQVANHIDFKVPLAAGQSKTIYVNVPFRPASEAESRWLAAADFARERARVAQFWRDTLAQGAKLELPERYPVDVWETNLHHMMTTAERNPDTGHTITLTAIGWYEGVWASLSAMEVIALDERGFHADAAAYLEPFIAWQGTMDPPGEFKTKEGFLASNDPYTWVRWVSNHGFLLWAMANHYRMSADRAWLDAKLPNMLAAVDWIERERARNKKLGADGSKPPHWGLLPPGATGDGAPNCYGFMGDAVTWRGLDAVATVLEEIGHPRAAATRAAADEYKKAILTGVDWAKNHTPKYKLQSTGAEIPFIANDIYNVWKINTGLADPNVNFHIWWMDVGPLHLVDLGVLDPKSELTGCLLQAAADRWMKGNITKAEPYYVPQRTAYLGRDQIDDFLTMYYTLLVEGMDRQTFVTGEYHHGQQNLPVCDAEQSRIQRMMLVRENNGGVDYATATPRAWLQDGKRIALSNACTYYGKTSLAIQSQAAQGTITARVTPPSRKPVPLRLKLRHPEGKPLQSVTINGQPAPKSALDGEWIRLPEGTKQTLEIVACY